MNAHAKYIFIDGTFMPTQPSHNQIITQERHVQKQNRRSPSQNLYARRICTHRFMVRFQSVQGVALKKRLQSRDESGTFVNSSNGTHFSPKSLSDRLSRRNDGLIPAWTSQVMVYVKGWWVLGVAIREWGLQANPVPSPTGRGYAMGYRRSCSRLRAMTGA